MEEFVVRQRLYGEMNRRGAWTQGFDLYQHIGHTVASLLSYLLHNVSFKALKERRDHFVWGGGLALTAVCGKMSVQEQHGRSSPTISVTESENRFMWSCTKQTQTGPSTEIRQTRYRTHFFGAVSIFVNAACCVLTFRIKEAVHRRGGTWGSVVVKELRY